MVVVMEWGWSALAVDVAVVGVVAREVVRRI